jgi:DeoR family fructose operon transcriptional repressor
VSAAAKRSGLLGPERHRQLCRRLLERGSIRVGEEARTFGVSGETIRRDIKALVDARIADAVFGGAVLRAGVEAVGLLPVDQRQRVEEEAKRAIGAAAARRVEHGQVVILDAGTTTLSLARHLRAHQALTIVTNSLAVAQVASTIPTCATYVIGGKLVPSSVSMVGPPARRELATISADWAFLGAAAIGEAGDFASADPEEAEIKRAMIRAARSVAVVADRSKFAARALMSFAAPRDIGYLFTSGGAPAKALRILRRAGVAVEVCGGASWDVEDNG